MTVSDRRKRLLLAGAAISALMIAAQVRPSPGEVRAPREPAGHARGAAPVARQAPTAIHRSARPVSLDDARLDTAGTGMTLVAQRLGLLVGFGVAAPGAPRSFTVLGAGDILLHPGLWAEGRRAAAAAHRDGYYFDPIFASAVPDISGADIAICHMETPYGNPDGPFTGYPVFEVPPQIAQTIHDVGYDSCSTGSNHSLDGGLAGIERELDALDAAGVKHTGSARDPAEAMAVDMMDVRGIKVAQLSYAYGFNGIPRPKGEDWIANLISLPDILAAAHRAKQAGADVVVLSLHWGTEYQSAPDAQQLTLARQLLASPDIDLILGCHAHVVQPIAEIGDKWVAYGMGNQVATQPFSLPTQDGVMPRFTFTEVAPHHFVVTKAEAIPTYMNLDHPIRLIDLPTALAGTDLSAALRARYLASWNRTAKVVDSLGAADDGLAVVGGD